MYYGLKYPSELHLFFKKCDRDKWVVADIKNRSIASDGKARYYIKHDKGFIATGLDHTLFNYIRYKNRSS